MVNHEIILFLTCQTQPHLLRVGLCGFWEPARAAGENPPLPPEVAQAYNVYDESPPTLGSPNLREERKNSKIGS